MLVINNISRLEWPLPEISHCLYSCAPIFLVDRFDCCAGLLLGQCHGLILVTAGVMCGSYMFHDPAIAWIRDPGDLPHDAFEILQL
jgi:hypothetical protein